MIPAPLGTIFGKISAILVAGDPPDILDGSVAAFERDALDSNPTLVLRSGNSQISHVGVKKSCNVRESVVRVAVGFL